jgi:hypothetical protein
MGERGKPREEGGEGRTRENREKEEGRKGGREEREKRRGKCTTRGTPLAIKRRQQGE